MPKCSYRKYTLSGILNVVIESGFVIKRFDEHPAWTDNHLPGEFTVIGYKPVRQFCVPEPQPDPADRVSCGEE